MSMTPRNTSNDDPFVKLLTAMSSGGILAQEAQGQREMVASATLPTDLNGGKREEYEALGFVFGDVVPGDPMFREATLPAGWSRKGSEHSMWSYIADERGIERVGVFYKAAFYDRSAHMHLVSVGHKIVGNYIYADGDTLDLHPQLTETELRDALNGVENWRERIAESPDVYGKYTSRLDSLDTALKARLDAVTTP